MTYQEAIDFLYSKLPMFQRVGAPAFKKDLSKTKQLCQALGNPQTQSRFVHIAGTNGKGSSAHALAAVLQEAGLKTGLYTSPHLKDFTERIRINGQPIEQQAVVSFLQTYQQDIEHISPSFFEVTFGMAMWYFAQQETDVVVLETGMGGRLDSTNVVQPKICLITQISYDHQQFLGNTLPEIATEKAGIIKPGVPVVIGQYQQEVAHVFEQKAKEVQAPLYFATKRFTVVMQNKSNWHTNYLAITDQQEQLAYLQTTDLTGPYQQYNMAGILQTLHLMKEQGWPIETTHIDNGLKHVKESTGLKGRWQVLGQKPLILADTAHNAEAVSLMVNSIRKVSNLNLHIVWGCTNDKDPGQLLSILPAHAHFYFTQANIPRAMPAQQLAEAAQKQGLQHSTHTTVPQAIEAAKSAALPDDLIFIGGSTFVVAEIDTL